MQPHQSASIIRDKQLLYVCNDVYMIYGDCSLSAFVCMTFTLEIFKVSRKALLTTFQHVLKPKGQDRSFSDDSQNVRWRVPVWLGFSHHSYLVRFWKGHGLGWNKWYVMYSKLRSSSLSPRCFLPIHSPRPPHYLRWLSRSLCYVTWLAPLLLL